jgi:hypothetical protein
MAFLVMCAEKIRRLLRLFFVTIIAWFYGWQRPDTLSMALTHISQLETEELLVTV